ncbi:maleylpyruvate isomerase family mycothiol-dependent enzyme [Actinophytocola gossypii]|uniref:Maleylpyruvate isomerase family mycothiol-dependent enzyme n=1 Tax=Actinophytocola gossypii TaxID=2812003 RepID=A0ABT2JHA2_9PSEU|nr:maleylpyruvate isomerase family mycothiol-dependent enzyme [Actinophytocola gossypii]MCT2586659.1 maleylpyruvate isomerase family mycothiol-dependent enzyme [Actinophytocola gossypii]
MDDKTYLDYLDADHRRLRSVVAGALGEPVPSCPGWTGADLAGHVAEVYLHKTETMRRGAEPEPWPPDLGRDPLAALDGAYRELTSEFAVREPADHSVIWYTPDQTVGFWMRRMAFETVIHRVDAELAAGVTPEPIPAELAVPGIDEVLVCMLAFAASEYPEYLADQLASCDGDTVRIDVPEASWLVRLGPDVVTVERGQADAEAVVRGSADAALRWLWRRAGNEVVELDGNRGAVGKLHGLLGVATQ